MHEKLQCNSAFWICAVSFYHSLEHCSIVDVFFLHLLQEISGHVSSHLVALSTKENVRDVAHKVSNNFRKLKSDLNPKNIM